MTKLRAVADWADGTIASADLPVLAVPPFVTEERVEIVNVYVTVRNRREEYVSGLTREDFRILEDGVPQVIANFGVEDLALNVAFVLDASYSMAGRKLATARAALVDFVHSMSFPRDQAMIVEIHGAPVLRTGWTRDKATLLAGLDDLEARGNTALYDSILVAARALRDQDGRKVMVVLSDGMDINTDGKVNRPGSVYSFDQVLDYTKRADVMVYCVGLGKRLDKLYDIFARQPLAKILRTFADDTGGRAFFAKRVENLHQAFGQVVDDLRHQYSLGYSPSNRHRDGAWRKIEVEIPGEKHYRLNHRPGYYAPAS